MQVEVCRRNLQVWTSHRVLGFSLGCPTTIARPLMYSAIDALKLWVRMLFRPTAWWGSSWVAILAGRRAILVRPNACVKLHPTMASYPSRQRLTTTPYLALTCQLVITRMFGIPKVLIALAWHANSGCRQGRVSQKGGWGNWEGWEAG